MKKLAFFDFDGTITEKDTMVELIKYHKGNAGYYIGLALLSPVLAAYKAGLIPNWQAKQFMLAYFFKGMQADTFQGICDAFSKDVIPGLIRPQALEKINEFKKEGTRVIIVTASAEQWVWGWCHSQGLECLATCLEVKDNKLTGKLLGPNCHGKEKVARIKKHLKVGDYQEIYAFGDTKGDLDMLQLAKHKFYKPFVD